MNCPFCNNPPTEHSLYSEPEEYRVSKFVCYLTVLEAQRAAQRKAALDCLREYAELARRWRRISKKDTDELIKLRARYLVDQNMRHISVLVRGYRKVGIL